MFLGKLIRNMNVTEYGLTSNHRAVFNESTLTGEVELKTKLLRGEACNELLNKSPRRTLLFYSFLKKYSISGSHISGEVCTITIFTPYKLYVNL